MSSKAAGHERTFIEQARRRQIIDAALQTIAAQGYAQTSFAEIARQLGITKGLIAYHFDGKQDLIASVVHTIINNQADYIRAQVSKHPTAAEQLRVYIESSLEYIGGHRPHFVALVDLWGSSTSVEQKHAFSKTLYGPCISQLRAILEGGQQSGEFGAFDAPMLSHVLQGAMDGVMLQWVFDPAVLSLEACTRELVETYVRRVTAPDPAPLREPIHGKEKHGTHR